MRDGAAVFLFILQKKENLQEKHALNLKKLVIF